MNDAYNTSQNPFIPLSSKEILDELALSRKDYQQGNYQDFDEALDEISQKYDLDKI